MGLIKILDESVSNAIAAGEVVENPTSMIKELIENSLDAKSNSIEIYVKNGGLDVIINDDGCGMEKEDLLLSIERHATSKISTKDDLFKIKSYGFRGEALSSIAAVSKMILSSKTEDMKSATRINVLSGKITNLKEIEKTTGTHIEIKDLFFNTPARLKFLRKESTEYLNIKDTIIKEALANPNVKFLLNIEGKESIKTSGSGIENTILEIFGKNYLKNMKKFALGFLGNSNLYKSNRDSILIFVNDRSVKSKVIENAVIDSYQTKLMKGKYPTAFIFLDINPEEIDVNVHPSKKIVKFSKQSEVYSTVKNEIESFFTDDEEFVSQNLQSSLMQNQDSEDYVNQKNNNILHLDDFEIKDRREENNYKNLHQLSSFSKDTLSNFKNANTFNDFNKTINDEEFFVKEEVQNSFIKESRNENETVNSIFDTKELFKDFSELENINFKVIGQLFDTFILVERNGVFEIYDQHIIHERILYEKLKYEYQNKEMARQNLLVPLRLALDPKEKEIIMSNQDVFLSFGFEIDDFEKNDVLIRTVPIMDLRDSYENIIKFILNNILEEREVDIREHIITSMSCKGAIKANQKLKLEEMYSMVSKLHEVGEYTCPHGRPIIAKLSKLDLEKLFKRK